MTDKVNDYEDRIDWESMPDQAIIEEKQDRAVAIIVLALAELPDDVCRDIVERALADRAIGGLKVGDSAFVHGAPATVVAVSDDGLTATLTYSAE